MSKLRKRAMMLTQPVKDEYITEGLVLWLDGFTELTSEVIDGSSVSIWSDLSGQGNRAELVGITKNQDAVVFNGVNSLGVIQPDQPVSLLGVLSGLQNRTVEIVCKLNSTEGAQTVLLGAGVTTPAESGGAGLWYREASGGMKVGTWADSPSVTVADVTNRASYSIVYGDADLSNFSFYQNGIECLKSATDGSMYTSITGIGARYHGTLGWNYYLNGEICSVRVYNRQLTDAEREHNLAIDRRRFDF